MQTKTVVVFDLDDTLFQEIDFLRSAYQEISEIYYSDKVLQRRLFQEMYEAYQRKEDVFGLLVERFSEKFSKENLLTIYRNHKPLVSLDPETIVLFDRLNGEGFLIGIITDGRFITQNNKIDALMLNRWIKDENIIISERFGSEKPNDRNYRFFMDKYPGFKYVYIGDNVKKDFLAPNRLGWLSVCLRDSGRNIHKQDFSLEKPFLPQIQISRLNEVYSFL